jgi:pilus assembly protein CpaB
MAARRILVVVVALGLAGATAFYARSWIEGQRSNLATATAAPPPAQTIEYREILVAEKTLPTGAFVGPGNVRWQRWPTGSIPESYAVRGERDPEDFHGAVVRRPIGAGEPITDSAVVKPGERGFLAAVLEPGMRAISVPVTDTSSHAGLIFPGDRVDLVLTQTVTSEDAEMPGRIASETVLENVRILAMGRRVSDEAETGGQSARTATLEATPRQVELVALITELGKLSLSLRSLASDEHAEATIVEPERAEPVTWDSDISRVRRNESRPHARMVVMRGTRSESVNLSTGTQP